MPKRLTILLHRYLLIVFIAALFTIGGKWKQLKCPSADKQRKHGTHTAACSNSRKKNMKS